MTDYQGVAVFCEGREGRLATISAEGLGIGRKLADDLGEGLSAIVVGSGVADVAEEAVAGGADRAYVVDDEILRVYQTDACVAVMRKVIGEVMPRILIMGQNDIGRDLAPRLAFGLGTTATLDCIGLSVDPGTKRLLQTKPVYGGNAVAVYAGRTGPQIIAVRRGVMTPPVPDASRRGEIINIDAGIDASAARVRLIDTVAEDTGGVRLEDADIVVAGGRGIGSAAGFARLAELAGLFKGAVGASRPPCDNGWVADTAQIGLTGRIVAPGLYIAVAVSGSSQHLSGCSGARNIVAINTDPEANIFRRARYGVVGDWEKVLPAFTAKVRELLNL